MKTVFIAKLGYNRANLARADLVRETLKTYWVENHENLLGHQYPSARILKRKPVFHSEQEAMVFLIQCAGAHVNACEENLARAKQELDKLHRIMEVSNVLDVPPYMPWEKP